MSFIELYSFPSNDLKSNLVYTESTNNIFGNILFDNNYVELNITNNDKNGKITGFVNSTENILSK